MLLAALILASSIAAPCTDAEAHQKPGRWISADDDTAMADPSFPKSKHATLIKKADRAITLLKQALDTPPGIEAKAYRTIRGGPYTKDGAVPFGVSSLYLAYYCVPDTPSFPAIRGTIQNGGETGTWIEIAFNGLGWLGHEKRMLGQEFGALFYVPKSAGELKGHTLWLPEVHRDKEEALLLTPDGRSPFLPITREDFLRVREKRVAKKLEALEKDLAKSPERFRAAIERTKTQLETERAELAAYREALSEDDRKTPALVRDPYAAPASGKLFATEEQGGRAIAKIDRTLFDAHGERDVIRVIAVTLRWEDKHPAKSEVVRRFKERFPLDQLKAMLGS